MKGEWRVQDFGIEALRVWFGASDYTHNELLEENEVGSRFDNEEVEGRVEMQHLLSLRRLARCAAPSAHRSSRAICKVSRSKMQTAARADRNRQHSAFVFEELDVTSIWRCRPRAALSTRTSQGSNASATTF